MVMNGISRETLVALHETNGIGWQSIHKLWVNRCEQPIAPGMREGDLRVCGLLPKQAAAAAISLREERIEQRMRQLERDGIGVLTIADPGYPSQLRAIKDPPHVLYYRGRLELAARPAIAIVGTRLATAYGRHVTETFAAAFADRGFAVVSGMARGIDACAHRAALHRAGGTAAVLGMPVDCIYPPENRDLYERIWEHGLLLSEAPPGAPYHTGMFPARNRIIAGLSLGVVIAEAPDSSGALITAERAIDQERDVYVIPGPVTSPRSRGALRLLAEGTAAAALGPEDVMKPYLHLLGQADESAVESGDDFETTELTSDERRIYELLLDAPHTAEELASATQLPIGQLHAGLISLQVKRKVQLLPGSAYGIL